MELSSIMGHRWIVEGFFAFRQWNMLKINDTYAHKQWENIQKKHFLGSNIFPTKVLRYFWVDDFPNFPKWDTLVSWRVLYNFPAKFEGFQVFLCYQLLS